MPDDDPASRRLWRESLIVEPRPPATEAADGNEAWALLDHPSLYHDVVFVDVTMPHRGLHRLGRIRESPRLNGGRVVLGARSTDRETVNPPVQLGTLRGFVKPATAPGCGRNATDSGGDRGDPGAPGHGRRRGHGLKPPPPAPLHVRGVASRAEIIQP